MAGSQFLRDFRLSHSLKKSAELRKKIQNKKEKQAQVEDQIPYKVILIKLLKLDI